MHVIVAMNHELSAADSDEVCQVGVSAGKLRDLRLTREIEPFDLSVGEMPSQVGGQCRPIECFAGAHFLSFSVHGPVRLSCA